MLRDSFRQRAGASGVLPVPATGGLSAVRPAALSEVISAIGRRYHIANRKEIFNRTLPRFVDPRCVDFAGQDLPDF